MGAFHNEYVSLLAPGSWIALSEVNMPGGADGEELQSCDHAPPGFVSIQLHDTPAYKSQ